MDNLTHILENALFIYIVFSCRNYNKVLNWKYIIMGMYTPNYICDQLHLQLIILIV